MEARAANRVSRTRPIAGVYRRLLAAGRRRPATRAPCPRAGGKRLCTAVFFDDSKAAILWERALRIVCPEHAQTPAFMGVCSLSFHDFVIFSCFGPLRIPSFHQVLVMVVRVGRTSRHFFSNLRVFMIL